MEMIREEIRLRDSKYYIVRIIDGDILLEEEKINLFVAKYNKAENTMTLPLPKETNDSGEALKHINIDRIEVLCYAERIGREELEYKIDKYAYLSRFIYESKNDSERSEALSVLKNLIFK